MPSHKGGYEIESQSDSSGGVFMKIKGSEFHAAPEEIFESYIKDFNLSGDTLKDKVVLDLGSGEEARFATYCNEHNIAKSVYSIDADFFLEGMDSSRWKSKKAYDEYIKYLKNSKGKRTFVNAVTPGLPFKRKSFDLILARASIGTNPGQDFRGLIPDVASLLKEGGKFMAAPIWSSEKLLRQELESALQKLPRDEFEWRFERGAARGNETRDRLVLVRKSEAHEKVAGHLVKNKY